MKPLSYYLQFRKFFGKNAFFIRHFTAYTLPRVWWQRRGLINLNVFTTAEHETIAKRCQYYNHMLPCKPKESWVTIEDYRFPFGAKKKFSCYFFDLYEWIKYFKPTLRFQYLFGDITEVSDSATIVKSRPIAGDNANSVLINLDKFRHFYFVHDKVPFKKKKNMMISRNIVRQPHRILLLEKYYGHPLCNVGQVNKDAINPSWVMPFISLSEQLKYKFICCIEGHDVATNLKWVMSSNSVAVMPKPTYETWFMEGTLIPNYHYIEIAPDYHDLPERLQYYIEHTDEAEAIIQHAHEYIQQFSNKRLEAAISQQVLLKYFRQSGQL